MSDQEQTDSENTEPAVLLLKKTDDLNENTVELRRAVEVSESRRKRDRTIYLSLIMILLIVVVPVLIVLVQTNNAVSTIRNVQKGNGDNSKVTRQISAQNQELLRQITDCVQPEGTCSKATRAQIAQVVASVVDSNGDGLVDSGEILDELHAIEAFFGIVPVIPGKGK